MSGDTTRDLEDAKTLAIWCSRSSAAYNIGAWQTALLLRPSEFRTKVARQIAALNLPADNPAMEQWVAHPSPTG